MYGKSKILFPKNPIFFKEDSFCQFIRLSPSKPDIADILSFLITPEILDLRLVDTIYATSEEGIKLKGKSLFVRIKLNGKITYTSTNKNQSVHGFHYSQYTSLSIVLPNKFQGLNVSDLINCNRIKVTPYVESNYARLSSNREIFSSLLIFVNGKFCI